MIRLEDVQKIYRPGREISVPALRGITLEVTGGEFVAIMGASGSGKSTLMHIIGCLDRPSGGRYFLDNEEISKKGDNDLAEFRNKYIGFVFQSFNLLPRLNALENVELPMVYRGVRLPERRKRAEEALELVGLSDRLRHRPAELSGGEQQRVAIARALVGEPSLLLADEPTGNLDSTSSAEVIEIFCKLNQRGITVVFVTHEEEIAAFTRRIIRLRDGLVIEDRENRPPRGYAVNAGEVSCS
ncbi:MAG: ABC transporter ATP-binding protein [Dethiobacter sp.]|jgi:putative ABC transport system ATP-binding protein|nr:MAG: ABC transporter ATP-binding protein [Dethiobacter sp.]